MFDCSNLEDMIKEAEQVDRLDLLIIGEKPLREAIVAKVFGDNALKKQRIEVSPHIYKSEINANFNIYDIAPLDTAFAGNKDNVFILLKQDDNEIARVKLTNSMTFKPIGESSFVPYIKQAKFSLIWFLHNEDSLKEDDVIMNLMLGDVFDNKMALDIVLDKNYKIVQIASILGINTYWTKLGNKLYDTELLISILCRRTTLSGEDVDNFTIPEELKNIISKADKGISLSFPRGIIKSVCREQICDMAIKTDEIYYGLKYIDKLKNIFEDKKYIELENNKIDIFIPPLLSMLYEMSAIANIELSIENVEVFIELFNDELEANCLLNDALNKRFRLRPTFIAVYEVLFRISFIYNEILQKVLNTKYKKLRKLTFEQLTRKYNKYRHRYALEVEYNGEIYKTQAVKTMLGTVYMLGKAIEYGQKLVYDRKLAEFYKAYNECEKKYEECLKRYEELFKTPHIYQYIDSNDGLDKDFMMEDDEELKRANALFDKMADKQDKLFNAIDKIIQEQNLEGKKLIEAMKLQCDVAFLLAESSKALFEL